MTDPAGTNPRRSPDPWPIIEWLAENMPRALELCPYKVSGESVSREVRAVVERTADASATTVPNSPLGTNPSKRPSGPVEKHGGSWVADFSPGPLGLPGINPRQLPIDTMEGSLGQREERGGKAGDDANPPAVPAGTNPSCSPEGTYDTSSNAMTRPQRILLDAAMNALGECGRKLRADGWDAEMTVHTIPTLHVALTVQINTGPTPIEAA